MTDMQTAADAALSQGVILVEQPSVTNQQEQPVLSQPGTNNTPPAAATNGWGGGTNPSTAGTSTGWGQH